MMRTQKEVEDALNQVKINYHNALLHNDRLGRIQDARTIHALSWVLGYAFESMVFLPEDFEVHNPIVADTKRSPREEQLAAGSKLNAAADTAKKK